MRLVFEYGDTESASLLARHTVSKLAKFVDDLKNESEQNKLYIEMAIKNKLPTYEDDCRQYSSQNEGVSLDDAALNELSIRLEQYLNVFERELKNMYQTDFQLSKILIKYLKPLLIVAAALLLGYFSYSLITWVRTRHQGLVGEYFNDKNLTKYERSHVDQEINFKWAGGPPIRGVNRENFSVQWTGYLKVPESGPYEFVTHSDDGIRMWIDDKLLIDNWTIHRLMIDNAEADLPAGPHAIKIEYFQAKGGATVRLFWKFGAMGQPAIIPAKYLVPEEKYATP